MVLDLHSGTWRNQVSYVAQLVTYCRESLVTYARDLTRPEMEQTGMGVGVGIAGQSS